MSAAHTHCERATSKLIFKRGGVKICELQQDSRGQCPEKTKHDSWGYKVQGPPLSPHPGDGGAARGGK